jgi:hypothetical protein
MMKDIRAEWTLNMHRDLGLTPYMLFCFPGMDHAGCAGLPEIADTGVPEIVDVAPPEIFDRLPQNPGLREARILRARLRGL